jgi:hypothetical protein
MMPYWALLFHIISAAASSQEAPTLTVWGKRLSLSLNSEQEILKDCAVYRSIGSVRRISRSLASQQKFLQRESKRAKPNEARMAEIHTAMRGNLLRLQLLGSQLLAEDKWAVVYRWEIPAHSLISDGMAFPYAAFNSQADLFGASANLEKDRLKLGWHQKQKNKIYLTVDFSAQVSSYALCAMPAAVKISTSLDFSNVAGDPNLVHLRLMVGRGM